MSSSRADLFLNFFKLLLGKCHRNSPREIQQIYGRKVVLGNFKLSPREILGFQVFWNFGEIRNSPREMKYVSFLQARRCRSCNGI